MAFQQSHPPSRILILGDVFPEPGSSAAGSRMLDLCRLFQNRGADLTFASVAVPTEWSSHLETLGMNTARIALNDASFDAFIQRLDPQVVLFDRFMTEEKFGWRVQEQCPDALRILDTVDLHALREARRDALKTGAALDEISGLATPLAYRETASILRADLSLIISEYEYQLLQERLRLPETNLHYFPLLAEPARATPPFEEREHFMTIGNFRHPPNLDAVLHLKETIWPLIRQKLPNAQLHVYGAYMPPRAAQWHAPSSGFHMMDRAPDAGMVMEQHRICLAPLRFGAGLKGKLLDAMRCGTPSLTTPVGAEGMQGDLPWPGAVCEDPQSMADMAVLLHEDQAAWETAGENGQLLLKKRFSREEHEPRLQERITHLLQDLNGHRKKHFLGAMVQHHTLHSSRYMGKWIEAKNRLPE